MAWEKETPISPSWEDAEAIGGAWTLNCSVRGSSGVVGYAVVGCAVVGVGLNVWDKEDTL